MRPYRLTFVFAIVSMTAIAVVAAILFVSTGNQASDILAERAELETASDLSGLIAAAVGDVARQTEGAAGQTLEALIGREGFPRHYQNAVGPLDLLRGELYDPDGRVVWSSEGSSGAADEYAPVLFGVAKAGEAVSALRKDLEFTDANGVLSPYHAVEGYAPVSWTSNGRVVGVARVYSDFTAEFAVLNEGKSWLIVRTALFMGGLFAALLAFVAYLDRRQHWAGRRAVALERDARDRARREAHERSALVEIGRLVSHAQDMGEAFEKLPELIRSVVPFDRIVITSLDEDTRETVDTYVSGLKIPGHPVGTHHPTNRSIAARVAQSREVLCLDEEGAREIATIDPSYAAGRRETGLKSMLVVPLVSRERVVGTLNLHSKQPAPYGSNEVGFVQQVGVQVAGTIANSRLHAELAVRSMALETAGDMIMITDRVGTVEYVNTAFLEHTGYAREEVIGRVATAIDHSASEDPAVFTAIGETITRGETWKGMIRSRKKGGTEYPEEMTVTPVSDAKGGVGRTISIKRDVSERVEAEREREHRIRVDAENRELVQVSEAKSAFLTTVSHELKTPLTSIIAFTDIIARDKEASLSEQRKQQLQVIQRNEQRLKILIEDLLDVSRADTGTLRLEPREFDARELLDEVCTTFIPILDAKNQLLETSLPEGVLMLHADRARLGQVASNLISNASKYSPERAHVEVTARGAGGQFHLCVQDNGIGIAEEDIGHLFTPFFRADNEYTRSVSGTGLGLVITKAIVEGHGGSIKVNSALGAGTTVSVSIPGLL